jgi:hypothetical protein
MIKRLFQKISDYFKKAPNEALIRSLAEENQTLTKIPDIGKPFICYKKVREVFFKRGEYNGSRDVVLTLFVPGDAARRNGVNRFDKLRVSEAYVVGAEYAYQTGPVVSKKFCPLHTFESVVRKNKRGNNKFRWKLKRWHTPHHPFNPGNDQCESGLHAYIDKSAAVNHS